MKRLMWISRACLISAVCLGTAGAAFAQATQSVSAVADVTFDACSGQGCQPAITPTPGPTPGATEPQCNNGAGPNPATISVTVSLCQVNGVLRGVGTGKGFQVGRTYVSLLYKNPSTGTCSRAPDGLTPLPLQNAADPSVDNDFASMMLGIWAVSPDGSGILIVNKQAPVTGLQNYRTVSVREMQVPNAACYRADLDPAPQLNALRACGSLRFGPACAAANVCEALCAANTRVCETIKFIGSLFGNTANLCEPVPSPPPININ